jgi:hypothetical protein
MKTKEPVIHLDYFGRELLPGDFVVFYSWKTFQVGQVQKSTPAFVLVIGFDRALTNYRTDEKVPFRKRGHECLKVDEQEVTIHLLKK